MSAVFPPVKENIYILSSPCVPGLPESLPGAGAWEPLQGRRLSAPPPAEDPTRSPQAGGREGNWWPCGFVLLRPLAAARGAGTHPASPRPSSSTPPLLASTFPTSKGAALTAPHEIIIHYVTKREERESKYLDGIRGNPRRDDLGAVIIHLIGAWGKLLDREWN